MPIYARFVAEFYVLFLKLTILSAATSETYNFVGLFYQVSDLKLKTYDFVGRMYQVLEVKT